MVSVQASVLSERRGGQLSTARANKQRGRRAGPATDRRPPRHNTQQPTARRHRAKGKAREGEESEKASRRRRRAKGRQERGKRARQASGRRRRDGRGRTTERDDDPEDRDRPRPEAHEPPPGGSKERQHATAQAARGEDKRTKLIPTTTRHKRGFWCEPDRDTPSAGQYQVKGRGERFRGAGRIA